MRPGRTGHAGRMLALWLGHQSLKSTEIYLRADPTEKLNTIEAALPRISDAVSSRSKTASSPGFLARRYQECILGQSPSSTGSRYPTLHSVCLQTAAEGHEHVVAAALAPHLQAAGGPAGHRSGTPRTRAARRRAVDPPDRSPRRERRTRTGAARRPGRAPCAPESAACTSSPSDTPPPSTHAGARAVDRPRRLIYRQA